MRLFTAVLFDDETKDMLFESRQKVKSLALKGNFSSLENLHLTLNFLGETDARLLPGLCSAMDSCAVHRADFTIELDGLGRFRKKGGDVIWAGIAPNPQLQALYRGLCSCLSQKGFPIQDRSYSPHVTLGREVRLSCDFETAVKNAKFEKRAATVRKISLMESKRIGGELTYTPIYESNFGRSE